MHHTFLRFLHHAPHTCGAASNRFSAPHISLLSAPRTTSYIFCEHSQLAELAVEIRDKLRQRDRGQYHFSSRFWRSTCNHAIYTCFAVLQDAFSCTTHHAPRTTHNRTMASCARSARRDAERHAVCGVSLHRTPWSTCVSKLHRRRGQALCWFGLLKSGEQHDRARGGHKTHAPRKHTCSDLYAWHADAHGGKTYDLRSSPWPLRPTCPPTSSKTDHGCVVRGA